MRNKIVITTFQQAADTNACHHDQAALNEPLTTLSREIPQCNQQVYPGVELPCRYPQPRSVVTSADWLLGNWRGLPGTRAALG